MKFGLGKDFLDSTQKVKTLKGKIDESYFMKTKNVCSLKDIVKKNQRKATQWEKISAIHLSDNRLAYPEYIKTVIVQ